MCSPFSCGSFKNLKSYDIDEFPLSPCTTPRRAKSYRSYSTKRRKDGNNPYANQGLDKFSALVAELEEKKQKIYTQKGSEDISFIYFTYKKSDDLRPIIVKVKKKQQQQHEIITTTDQIAKVVIKGASYSEAQDKIDASSAGRVDKKVRQPKREELSISQRFKTFGSLKLKIPRHVFSYFPVTIVLILLALAIRGRSFAILCTTVAWYLVPIICQGI